MKFVLGFLAGAAAMFGIWWYTKYIEALEEIRELRS